MITNFTHRPGAFEYSKKAQMVNTQTYRTQGRKRRRRERERERERERDEQTDRQTEHTPQTHRTQDNKVLNQ